MPLRYLCRSITVVIAAQQLLAPTTSSAQRALTAADYDRAVRMLGPAVNPLVVGGTVTATWLPDDRFYYRITSVGGSEWVIVDPAKKSRTPLFRSVEVAHALARAGAGTIDPRNIPIESDAPAVVIPEQDLELLWPRQ